MFRSPDSAVSAPPRARGLSLTDSRTAAVAVLVLGALLAAICFGAAAGTELSRTTVVEVLMVLVGGLVVAGAVVWGPRGPLYGATALAGFVLLAILTALSVTWAQVPELAYIEAGRTLAYLAVFAAAIAAARLAPQASPVVIKGITAAALAAVAYALLARVWPASLAEDEISNRIGQPFEYWNAVGCAAALAVPGVLWLGARRGGSLWGRALAYPGAGAAFLAILLTQSRGALAAASLGALAWIAIVPLRLRSLPVMVLPAIAAGAVGAWALSKDAFAVSAQPLAVKEAVAGEFGLLLLAMTLGLFGVGLALGVWLERAAPPPRLRRRAGLAAAAATGLLVVAGLAGVAASDRGLGGTVSDRFDELTSETDTSPTQGAERFTAASSTRAKYWDEAGEIFAERRSVGLGAGTFRVARLRHRTDPSVTAHAHGFVPQTMADLGLAGLVVTGLLLVAWLVAAGRATALYPRRLPFARRDGDPPPRRDWTSERIALVALTLIAVVFGLQSLIDWTWFVPGVTAMALVAAGFVAGRGPAGPAPEPAAESPARPERARWALAAGVLLAALLAAWAIWQPEGSDRAVADAVALDEAGDSDAALSALDDARDANPLSSDPLLVRAAIETQAGREGDALATLEDAVLKFPGDPDTWYRLAAFQLGTLDRPARSLETVQGAIYLDPLGIPARNLFLEGRARLRSKAQERLERRPD